jgi:Flp pilus assembly pilin Flp
MRSNHLATSVVRALADESGVTGIEYGLIAAALGMATAVAMLSLGPAVSSTFQLVAAAFPA